MKKYSPIINHDPLLNLQVLAEKDSDGTVQETRLMIFIDTDEDDLNRTLTNFTIKQPHHYDLSIEVQEFEKYQGSEFKKFVTGKIFLVGTRNNVNRLPSLSDEDFKILLAEPKLLVQPNKINSEWLDISIIKKEITFIWLQAFSNALSGYLVHSYNQLNAQSIKNAISASIESSNEHADSELNLKFQNKQDVSDSFFKKLNDKSKVLFASTAAIGAAALLLLSYNLGANKSTNTLSATSNGMVPIAQPMSVEDAKKAQLRELGINPDDLAADLGCFVE